MPGVPHLVRDLLQLRLGERDEAVIAYLNAFRHRIPFAYWLAYDAVLIPFLGWGIYSLSAWFLVPGLMLLFAAVFDITEAIVKWSR